MEGNPGRAPRLVGVVVNCLDLTIRKSPGNEAEVTGASIGPDRSSGRYGQVNGGLLPGARQKRRRRVLSEEVRGDPPVRRVLWRSQKAS